MATTTRTGVDIQQIPKFGGPVLNSAVWSHEYTAGQLAVNEVLEMGYVPDGATVVGFFLYSDDLDSGATPALARKVTVGSTDVKTGITTGQSAGGVFVDMEPVTVSGDTLVKITVTTAAATAAAGTTVLVPLYIAN